MMYWITFKIYYIKYSQIGRPMHFCCMYISWLENLHIQGIMSVFEWLQSCDGLKFGQLQAHLFI